MLHFLRIVSKPGERKHVRNLHCYWYILLNCYFAIMVVLCSQLPMKAQKCLWQ